MGHQAAHKSVTQNSRPSASLLSATGFSPVKSETSCAGRRSFAEDFNMEHSASRIPGTRHPAQSIGDSVDAGTSRSAQAHSKASPNCVYFG